MGRWEPQTGGSDEWYTPAYIFDALDCVFDLDVASPPDGPRHTPCLVYFADGSLERDWHGFVWMNPPFGGRNGLEPWLKKFYCSRQWHCVALAPDRTSAPWFQDAAREVDLLLFLSPRVKFEKPDGSVGAQPGNGTVLMAIGGEGVEALARAAPKLGLLVKHAT